MELGELIESVTALVDGGKVRAWGVLNWPPELLTEAVDVANVPPCAAQVPYNLLLREHAAAVDDRISVIASAPLWFGALTGNPGRRIGARPVEEHVREAAQQLAELARELGATPAQLALAFCLADHRVGSVLFGASKPEQVSENAGALDLRLSAEELERLRAVGA
jgi:aryl-alcohol dehydrogenase-like predicted oxidoreductase